MKGIDFLLSLLVLASASAGPSVPQLLKDGSLPRIRTGIIGGDVATQGQFPFMVSLQVRGTHVCGGSLLNENHVLTIAACVLGYKDTDFNVVAGEQNLRYDSGVEQILRSDYIVIHKLSMPSGANDLAIVRTSGNFELIEGLVEVVPLPDDQQEPAEGTMCTAIGWGSTEVMDYQVNWVPSDDLRFAEIPYVTDDECRTFYWPDITTENICAGSVGGKAFCALDGGSPLMCDGVQAGVDAYGAFCNQRPGVSIQVSYYLGWINIHKHS